MFRFAFQSISAFDLLITGRSHFLWSIRSLAIVQQCIDHTNKDSIKCSPKYFLLHGNISNRLLQANTGVQSENIFYST